MRGKKGFERSMTVLFLAVAVVFTIAAVSDIMSYRIPNWCSLAVIAAYVARCVIDWHSVNVPWDLLAAAIAFAGGYASYALKLFGAGDVKLTTVGVLWAGWGQTAVLFLLITAVAGGVLALIVLAYRALYAYRHYFVWLERRLPNFRELPYGVAISFGAIVIIAAQMHFLELPKVEFQIKV